MRAASSIRWPRGAADSCSERGQVYRRAPLASRRAIGDSCARATGLTHLGKPELETLSTFFGGLGFGWIAWRTRSVAYGALLHAYLIGLILFATSG
ncbi:MAG TPA: CPBP family intramembrane glutamic endopeptidase [Candidatus Limnocylindria bacterium]|jgi:hypothetical protein